MRKAVDPSVVRLKETVTIPRPMRSVYPRGLTGVNKHGPHITLRIETDENETILEVCHFLGMSRSSFVRWCAYQVACDMKNQMHELKRKRR